MLLHPWAPSPQALSPRQLQILASASAAEGKAATAAASGKLVQEIPRDYLMKRLGGAQAAAHVDVGTPLWGQYVKTEVNDPHPDAPKMDTNTSFVWNK